MKTAIAFAAISTVLGASSLASASAIYSDSLISSSQTDLNGFTPDTSDPGNNTWASPTASSGSGQPTITPFYRSATGTTIVGGAGSATVNGVAEGAYLPISLTQGLTYSTSVTFTLLANGALENAANSAAWVEIGLWNSGTPPVPNAFANNANNIHLLIRTAVGGGQNEGDLQYANTSGGSTSVSGDGGTTGSSHTLTMTVTPNGSSNSNITFYEDGTSLGTLTLQGAETSFADVYIAALGVGTGNSVPGAYAESVATNFTFTPEPASLGLISVAGLALLGRRRQPALV